MFSSKSSRTRTNSQKMVKFCEKFCDGVPVKSAGAVEKWVESWRKFYSQSMEQPDEIFDENVLETSGVLMAFLLRLMGKGQGAETAAEDNLTTYLDRNVLIEIGNDCLNLLLVCVTSEETLSILRALDAQREKYMDVIMTTFDQTVTSENVVLWFKILQSLIPLGVDGLASFINSGRHLRLMEEGDGNALVQSGLIGMYTLIVTEQGGNGMNDAIQGVPRARSGSGASTTGAAASSSSSIGGSNTAATSSNQSLASGDSQSPLAPAPSSPFSFKMEAYSIWDQMSQEPSQYSNNSSVGASAGGAGGGGSIAGSNSSVGFHPKDSEKAQESKGINYAINVMNSILMMSPLNATWLAPSRELEEVGSTSLDESLRHFVMNQICCLSIHDFSDEALAPGTPSVSCDGAERFNFAEEVVGIEIDEEHLTSSDPNTGLGLRSHQPPVSVVNIFQGILKSLTSPVTALGVCVRAMDAARVVLAASGTGATSEVVPIELRQEFYEAVGARFSDFGKDEVDENLQQSFMGNCVSLMTSAAFPSAAHINRESALHILTAHIQSLSPGDDYGGLALCVKVIRILMLGAPLNAVALERSGVITAILRFLVMAISSDWVAVDCQADGGANAEVEPEKYQCARRISPPLRRQVSRLR